MNPRTPVEQPDIIWRSIGVGGPRFRSTTGCTAIVGSPRTEGRWHVSVSHPDRYPTWDELASARDTFTPPDVEMHMVFPRRGEYVNAHQTCLHLWGDDDA